MSVQLELRRPDDERALSRNFVAHAVEGGLYMGGISFVHPHTVLPGMLQALGAPSAVIAVAPSILLIGFILPGMFVAHRIEQLPLMRGWVVKVGVWQRLPFLVAAAVLLVAGDAPAVALPTVLLAPLVSGLCGGLAVNAWKEYVASTIPERVRSSLWATRFVISTLIGFGAGGAVSFVLGHYPGARGYAVLHFATFAFLAASFFVFLLSSENPRSSAPAAQSLWQFMRGVPALVRQHPRFQLYLLARLPLHGIFVLLPFLGIHALSVLQKPDAFLGQLLTANMLGSLAGFVLGGYLGDRYGGRAPMLLCHLGWIGVAAATPLVTTALGFQALFVTLGAATSLSAVGTSTLDLEITPLERRVAYQAVLGTFTLLALLGTSLVSAAIRELTRDISALSIPALVLLLVSFALFIAIEEPRQRA
jgi:MFS family permease